MRASCPNKYAFYGLMSTEGFGGWFGYPVRNSVTRLASPIYPFIYTYIPLPILINIVHINKEIQRYKERNTRALMFKYSSERGKRLTNVCPLATHHPSSWEKHIAILVGGTHMHTVNRVTTWD